MNEGASSGARLTLNNYVVSDDGPTGEKDVYHRNHVPRAAPTSEAGLSMNDQHMMYVGAPHGPRYAGVAPSGVRGLQIFFDTDVRSILMVLFAFQRNSQAVSSSAKVKSSDALAEGKGVSGYVHIPDHIAKAKEEGGGFSGTRLL